MEIAGRVPWIETSAFDEEACPESPAHRAGCTEDLDAVKEAHILSQQS